ncbi:TPA: hypothetical protein CPT80_03175 [Candidatus Gastranaerophilales bacterium HUM_9]|nr:MAG TPA: hypothetical protein CPT80_03175 [Candidatus Gastranaerophilales bacterium HUM_9]HBX34870.1 hypothetical protein [Cyanobacteria bacterium UBA11440]
MKRIFVLIVVILLSAFVYKVSAETVLKSGVSLEKLPNAIFGTWQVNAQLDRTSNYSVFKVQTKDVWNLSRSGNVITLENPFTKAKAVVKVNQIEGNVVVFSRGSTCDNRVLKDTVTIRIEGDKFAGYDDLVYETLSLHDGHVMKRDTAKYLLKGTKISGMSILKK